MGSVPFLIIFLSLCEMLLVIEHRAVGQKAHPARETGCTLASDFIHDRMNLKMTTLVLMT